MGGRAVYGFINQEFPLQGLGRSFEVEGFMRAGYMLRLGRGPADTSREGAEVCED